MHHTDPIYPEIQVLLKALTYDKRDGKRKYMLQGHAKADEELKAQLNFNSIPQFMSCPLQTVIALVPF